MRKLILFLITIIGVAFITSCKKDEVKATLTANITAPVITAGLTTSTTPVVLNQANKNVSFDIIWSGAYYGFRGSVTYTLQVDKKGNNFATPISLGSPASTVLNSTYAISMLTNDFNNKLLLMQVNPEIPVAAPLEFRVKAYINDSVPVIYSPVTSVTYTPYYIPIIYNKVYVPGDYQGWSPGDPYLASLDGSSKYEGYINFTSTGGYKITSDPDWNHTNWGAGTGAGTLSTAGGNITIPGIGYYKVNVNTTDLTISTMLTTWTIIGDVTGPNYNWSNDMVLTYNTTTKVWSGTADLHAGSFKFRANLAWSLAYGSTVAGKLDPNGGNIPLPVAGNYTITLNFSVPPIYRYTIVKN
jgi:hypothetical protein